MVTSTLGKQSRLLYVSDRTSAQTCLIDSGTEVCVFPATQQVQRFSKRGCDHQTANGKHKIDLDLRFHNRKFSWSFLLADVRQPSITLSPMDPQCLPNHGAPDKFRIAKKEFNQSLQLGIVLLGIVRVK